MEAVIVNFRGSRHRQIGDQMIIQVAGIEEKAKAESLIGKAVVWVSPAKKEIKGKIMAVHGNKGAMRVLFETGMPGQAVGSKVKIE